MANNSRAHTSTPADTQAQETSTDSGHDSPLTIRPRVLIPAPTPRKHHKDDDRANWVNGKRPKGYRTPEGREAAEKSKLYKSGTTIPHLVYPCTTYEGVLKHAVLGAIRK